jgi:hypothetical protein
MIGTPIGVYRITVKLGAGGMGEAYRDVHGTRNITLERTTE